MQKVRL